MIERIFGSYIVNNLFFFLVLLYLLSIQSEMFYETIRILPIKYSNKNYQCRWSERITLKVCSLGLITVFVAPIELQMSENALRLKQ